MAIIQISKLQHRSGNLVDLPQLSDAEFGWATDTKRLFIGKSSPNENIEVLTSYSNVNFSQIIGAQGNLNITGALAGQVLSYDGNNWVNYAGTGSSGNINLGVVGNVKILGGAIGYVLETDGTGKLSWTPKNTLYSNITNFYPTVFTGSIGTSTLSGVAIAGTGGQFTCTASSTTLYVGMAVTISGIKGGGGSITGYTDPTTYLISVTNGSTSFTLTTSLGAAIVTTSGTPTGLTYTLSNLLNISAATSGSVGVGTYITGTSVTSGTYITAYRTGTGGTGTYIVNTSQTIASTTLYGPLIMRVANTTPYTNGQAVTISGANGVANSSINGLTFYITLTANYASSGNVSLYTDSGRTAIANVSTLTYTNSPNAIATAALGGSGSGVASGSITTIQFNNNNILDGDTGFTYNYRLHLLTLNGNANVGNLNVTGVVTSSRLLSNATTGTTPIQVISTTLVPNLYVARANVSDYGVITTQTTGVFYPTFVSASSSANYALSSNANISFNAATGTLSSTLLTGTLTTAAQPNVTSVGTLAGLVVGGHITPSANVTYNLGNTTNRFNDLWLANSTIYMGVQTISANSTSVIISGSIVGNMSGNSTTAGTVTTAAQPNITSVGTLTSLVVTGNISGANLTGTHYGAATGLTAIVGANVTGQVPYAATANAVAGANVSGAVAFATTANTVAGSNVSGQVNYAATANFIAGANVSGAVSFATTANAVAGANVSGQVTFAATANIVAGSNVTGQVNYAATANAVAGANVSGQSANALVAGTVYTAAQPNITSTGTLTGLGVNGTVTAVNITANTGVFTGNGSSLTAINGSNVTGQVTFAATANAVAGANVSGQVNYAATANAVAGANVSGQVNYAATANAVTGANVSGAVSFATTANAVAGGNVSGAVNLATYATTANAVAGGNVSGAVSFATTANAVAGANVSGAVGLATFAGTANAVAGGNVSGTVANATYAITAGSTTTVTTGGSVTTTTITTGATATAGTITGNWSLAAGSKLNATYADLAECYKADAYYEAGTVLEFGGMNEVTLASDSTNRVAGVVSTNPAYVMNSQCEGEYIVQLALQGRAPCKVRGNVRKGDMMVSGGDGFARPSASPLMGTVIGKSLEDFTGTSGVIEVAVGRL